MKPAQRKEAEQLLKETTDLNTQIESALGFSVGDVRTRAKEAAESDSVVLVGTIGATLGGVGAAALSQITGYVLFATGPLGVLFGATIGVLLYRGIGYLSLERSLQKIDMSLGRILTQLSKLPPDTPEYVRNTLWAQYDNLASRYSQIVSKHM